MAEGKCDIYVFADRDGLEGPTLIGTLSAHFAKGKKAFGFEYDKDWFRTDAQRLLDPDIVFNIAISNTDDHLRNHGFILTDKGWVLTPAYDLNPSIEKDGLSLNIDMDDNALDFDLAKSVGEYFRLSEEELNTILDEVLSVGKDWETVAKEIGIKNAEIELMAGAFR